MCPTKSTSPSNTLSSLIAQNKPVFLASLLIIDSTYKLLPSKSLNPGIKDPVYCASNVTCLKLENSDNLDLSKPSAVKYAPYIGSVAILAASNSPLNTNTSTI